MLHEGRCNLHSFRREARNSAFDFGYCNSLIRSSSSSDLRRCGPFSVSSSERFSVGSLVLSLSSSYEECLGGLGIGRSSLCGTGAMDDGKLGYFKFLLFLMLLYFMLIIQK